MYCYYGNWLLTCLFNELHKFRGLKKNNRKDTKNAKTQKAQ